MNSKNKEEQKKPFRHLVGGRPYWKIGFVGFLVRPAGAILTAATPISLALINLWSRRAETAQDDPSVLFSVTTANVFWNVVAIAALLSLLLFLALRYLKRRTIRSLDIKYGLHSFAHEIRDEQAKIGCLIEKGEWIGKEKLETQLQSLLWLSCERVAEHFRLLLNDESIGASIRLASREDTEDTEDKEDKEEDEDPVFYKTYARSRNFSLSRSKTTEAIPRDGATPRIFDSQTSGAGVLIYDDIQFALMCGKLSPTKNFELYKDEIASMMVAPMNAWTKQAGEDMLGLLYVTSKSTKVFTEKYVDSMLFFADGIASAVACHFNYIGLSDEIRK